MPIVGGLDIHRKQITFGYLDTVTGEVRRGQIAPADREHLRAWLVRFTGRGDVAFAVEGCAGWRYVTEEPAAAGIAAHLGEPADTAAARGRKRRAKTDKTGARHLRTLLAEGRLPECWIPPGHILEYRISRHGPDQRSSRCAISVPEGEQPCRIFAAARAGGRLGDGSRIGQFWSWHGRFAALADVMLTLLLQVSHHACSGAGRPGCGQRAGGTAGCSSKKRMNSALASGPRGSV